MSETFDSDEFDKKWIQERLEREEKERQERQEFNNKISKGYLIFLITFILVGYFFIKSKGGF